MTAARTCSRIGNSAAAWVELRVLARRMAMTARPAGLPVVTLQREPARDTARANTQTASAQRSRSSARRIGYPGLHEIASRNER
jgi:hypothetical protein